MEHKLLLGGKVSVSHVQSRGLCQEGDLEGVTCNLEGVTCELEGYVKRVI